MSNPEQSIFPDLIKVREALWRLPHGRASVMVGSGFSRQAQAIALGEKQFPTWNELGRQMCAELNLVPSTETVPQIAQIYQDRFGHVALDAFIIRAIPDDGFIPGDNHRRLLALPWADIFTTNYDTLLERAALDTFNRRYETVLSPADLPQRSMPRIVKLHGSFPGTRPFIFTQKEYDKYHETHAPFVNLAREAAMETVFLLIGFSGDDPNFKSWTEWVQEKLGPYSPQIYLCNVLDLTPEAEADLRSRHVTPIDLGPMFLQENFPHRDVRRVTATTWLLEVLARGKPGRPTEWAPWERNKPASLSPPGPPEVGFTSSFDRWPRGEGKVTPERLRELTANWRSQRREYPGYLVAPRDIRVRIWHHTENWRTPLFDGLHEFPVIEQLELVREFVWRMDLCLVSLFTTEAHKIADLLERVNPFPGTLDLPAATASFPADTERAELWIELAFAVLRTAREDFEEDCYVRWTARLASLRPSWPAIGSRLDAEAAYWALARLDLAALETHLTDWRRREKTPWGRGQLAALLAEFGHSESARQVAEETLKEIRRHLPEAEPRYDLLSLEAWLLELLELLRDKPGWRKAEVADRMKELQRAGCDPDEVRDELQAVLENIEPPRSPLEHRRLNFDPGTYTRSVRLAGAGLDHEKLVSAFVALRLAEVAPVALKTVQMEYLAHTAARAAVWLESIAPMWALAFVVRTNDDRAIRRFMDRPMVASLTRTQVDRLWQLLCRPLDVALQRLDEHSPDKKTDLVFSMADSSMQLLSRLAFRLDADQRRQLVDLVARWLHSNRAASTHLYQTPVAELVRRLIFALEPAELASAALRLLAVPMVGENNFGFITPETRWIEPVDELNKRRDYLPAAVPVPDPLVERLAYLLRHGDKEESQRAMRRMLFLINRHWLTASQLERLRKAVWSRVDGSGMPQYSNHLYPYSIREVAGSGRPGVDEQLRANLLRGPWPALTSNDGRSASGDVFHHVSTRCAEIRLLFSPLYPRPAVLAMSLEDAGALLDDLLAWWHVHGGSLQEMATTDKWRYFIDREDARWLAGAILGLVGDVVLPLFPTNAALLEKSQVLLGAISSRGFSSTHAAIGLLLAGAVSAEAARAQLADALVSPLPDELEAGGWNLLVWMRLHAKGGLAEPPPASLADLLATRAAVASDDGRERACRWIRSLVEEFGENLSPATHKLILAALAALLEQTDPARWMTLYAQGAVNRDEGAGVIEARVKAAKLAAAVFASCRKRSLGVPAIVESWRKAAELDVFPEVRRGWTAHA